MRQRQIDQAEDTARYWLLEKRTALEAMAHEARELERQMEREARGE